MKITFILTDFPVYSQTFVLQQIKNLIDEGHEVKILANYNPKQNFVQPIYTKYKLAEKTSYFRDNIYEPDSDLNELRSLLDMQTDLFHCHFMPTGIALVQILNKLSLNKPVLITGYGVDVMAESPKDKFSYLNQSNISFIAVSDAIKQKMIYLGLKAEKIWIVPLTVDVDYFIKTNKKKNNITSFASVCRLVEKKGIDSAIKAFYVLKNKGNSFNFKYNIYGDGPSYGYLKELINYYRLEREITINKPVDHKEILKLFKQTDFLIQTSKTASNGDGEGLPTVVLEAQSSGIPVIGTYHSGIPEEVIDGKTGFLSHEHDIVNMANNLLKAVKMTNEGYKVMSKKSRIFIEKKFSDNSIKVKMFEIYNDRVKNKEMINIKEKAESDSSQLNIQPKHIKLLIFNHTAGLGGSERSLLELIDELQEYGVICKVILPYRGSFCLELDKRGVEYEIIEYYWWCSLNKLPKEEQVQKMNNSFLNLLDMRHKLDNWKPDVVFTNTLTIPWGAIYSQLTNKPHMTFIREFGDIDFGFDFFYGFKKSVNFIDTYSDFVFTNSKATLNHFKKYIDNKKLDFAYAFINIDRKLLKQKKTNLFKKHKSLKLSIMGALIPSKGQEEVVKAVTLLITKGLDIELAIVGDQHDRKFIDKLEKIIKTNRASNMIRFFDFVSNPYGYMNQSDVLIIASRNEAYGRVTIEAMSLGKPVIGTNSGATKELVINNKTGLLYKPGDYLELAEKIEFLYNNRVRIDELGGNGRLFHKKTFSKKVYGMKVHKRLKEISEKEPKKNALAEFMKDFSKSLGAEILTQRQTIESLKHSQSQLINEKEQLNQTLADIYSSKTWKILYSYKKFISILKKTFTGNDLQKK